VSDPRDLFRSAARQVPIVGSFADMAIDFLLHIYDAEELAAKAAARADILAARARADAQANAKFGPEP
jgi:hypothetical protein